MCEVVGAVVVDEESVARIHPVGAVVAFAHTAHCVERWHVSILVGTDEAVEACAVEHAERHDARYPCPAFGVNVDVVYIACGESVLCGVHARHLGCGTCRQAQCQCCCGQHTHYQIVSCSHCEVFFLRYSTAKIQHFYNMEKHFTMIFA